MQNAVAGFAVATIQARAVNKSLVRFIVIGFSINDDVTSPKGKSTPRAASSLILLGARPVHADPFVRAVRADHLHVGADALNADVGGLPRRSRVRSTDDFV